MTDKELEGLARQALNMAKTDFELHGFPTSLLLATYHAGEGLHRMSRIEAELKRRLGAGWLDDERLKEAGYGFLRVALLIAPPDAIVMVTPANIFKSTEKFAALPPDELKKAKERSDMGSEERHRMAAEGLFSLMDAYTAVVQTPERVCFCSQQFDRWQFVGQPETVYSSQAEHEGSGKMFTLTAEEEAELAQARANLLKEAPDADQ